MYDVIVVGARCAGSPTAMLLARKGHRVLLLDRARFPSDTVSTHAITGDGSLRLQRWGLLDRVLATNCPPVRRVTFTVGDQPFVLEPPLMQLCPRRTSLDAVLVEAARESGVDVVEGASVQELLWSGEGRVGGVLYRSGDGGLVSESATVVVGADGRNSFVAGQVGAELYNERSATTCVYYAYWSGIPNDGIEIAFAPKRAVFLFPTNDDQVLLAAGWPRTEFAEYRSDPLGNLEKSFQIMPGLRERVRKGSLRAPLSGMLTPDSYFRRSAGKGWALVGDAGNFKDPVLGIGINDAFRSADQLAEAIDAGLGGQRSMDDALRDYESLRDKTSIGSYEVTQRFASLEVTPEMVAGLVGRISGRSAA